MGVLSTFTEKSADNFKILHDGVIRLGVYS
jgi:hypothetical protein